MLDLNPRLMSDFRLGHVEKIEGLLDSGERWGGLLFYPVGYAADRNYPLVIQSVYGGGGAPESHYTLYGDLIEGLGPPMIAAYAAQVLTNRGIAVVQLDVADRDGAEEGRARMHAFEAVVQRLAEMRVVDRTKVGLAGFSRNGYWVEYTLTQSSVPFAAAIAIDNWQPSYVASTLSGYSGQAIAVNGGQAPFGEGLQAWLQSSPGFNVEKIRAPLRKVTQSGGLFDVLENWEIFGRLRYLKRPVEFQVMPDAEEHWTHNVQNPGQILAVMQGSGDWFDFWLNGHERLGADNAIQYKRWRKLRELHMAGGA